MAIPTNALDPYNNSWEAKQRYMEEMMRRQQQMMNPYAQGMQQKQEPKQTEPEKAKPNPVLLLLEDL